MNYDELIINWHAKATCDDYFSRFVFEYLAFIAFLRRKKFSETTDDRKAIQKLKQGESSKEKYLQKIIDIPELSNAWKKIKSELDSTPLVNVSSNSRENKWWNCLDDELNKSKEISTSKIGVIRNLKDWENMVEFWYSIRNNFFHGEKDSQDFRDQLLIENGYKTLRPLVDIFLSFNEEKKEFTLNLTNDSFVKK